MPKGPYVPLIKVRDKKNREYVKIVGLDADNTLNVDASGKGIHYYNTRLANGTGRQGGYEFVTGKYDYWDSTGIKFVTISKLLKVYANEYEFSKDEIQELKDIIADIENKPR